MNRDELDELLVHHAGAKLLTEYQGLVDAKDIDGLAGIVHPDVSLTRHDGTVHGAQAFLDLYRRFAASDVQTSHHMGTNVAVMPGPDGTATVDSKFLALTTHATGEARMIWGTYRDEIARHEGRWVLTAKTIAITKMAVLDESHLAPGGIDSFGKVPR